MSVPVQAPSTTPTASRPTLRSWSDTKSAANSLSLLLLQSVIAILLTVLILLWTAWVLSCNRPDEGSPASTGSTAPHDIICDLHNSTPPCFNQVQEMMGRL